MSRLERFQSSHLDFHALRSDECHQALSSIVRLVSSCAGPYGKSHVIRNACGGHMTITSSSLRMLSTMMISRSELKVVVSAILGHVKQYGDAGLFMAYLAVRLIKTCVPMDISHFTVSSLLHNFVSTINSYLVSDECEVVVKVDFSNVRLLLAYARSILTSKTLLNLQPTDCNNLSQLVVETFVEAIPSVAKERQSDGIILIGIENQPVSGSKVMKGVLLACPEISVYREIGTIQLKTNTETTSSGRTLSYIKAALITCSMAGDMEEMTQAVFEATEQQFSNIDRAVMQKMIDLCTFLKAENIGIVLCQKVIHPNIKAVLKSNGIFFVDRLGFQVIPYLRDLTGCVPVSSVMLARSQLQDCLGKLTSVSHRIEGQSSYLLLNNDADSSVVSLILCGEWEERVSELKVCVNTCIQGLSLLAKEPKFLMGGGCWQMNCLDFLEKQTLADLSKTIEELSCSDTELRQTLSLFVSSLRGWCLQLKSEQEHLSFDPSSRHVWRVPKGMSGNINQEEIFSCCCGFKSVPGDYLQDMDIVLDSDSSSQLQIGTNKFGQCIEDSLDFDIILLDSFTATVQALNKAAMTAGLLLSVGQCVVDRN